MSKIRNLLILVLFLLSACVTQKKFDDLLTERVKLEAVHVGSQKPNILALRSLLENHLCH